MVAGRGSLAVVAAVASVDVGSDGPPAEFEMAATVDGCEESMDVAISSSLDVAASSLWYIAVSLDLDAVIDLSIAIMLYSKELLVYTGKVLPYLLINVVRLCIFVFAAMVAVTHKGVEGSHSGSEMRRS